MESIIEQARRLSSGTLASLTSKTSYATLDAIRVEFIEFCEETTFRTWQPAWRAYWSAKTGVPLQLEAR